MGLDFSTRTACGHEPRPIFHILQLAQLLVLDHFCCSSLVNDLCAIDTTLEGGLVLLPIWANGVSGRRAPSAVSPSRRKPTLPRYRHVRRRRDATRSCGTPTALWRAANVDARSLVVSPPSAGSRDLGSALYASETTRYDVLAPLPVVTSGAVATNKTLRRPVVPRRRAVRLVSERGVAASNACDATF